MTASLGSSCSFNKAFLFFTLHFSVLRTEVVGPGRFMRIVEQIMSE